MNQQRRVSNKVKQRQLQTKFLQQQTKKMQQKLSQLKKQVQQQRQLKATTNFQSTVTRWKKTTRSDAPLKSYAKQILQQQKQAYKKFGIDEKKITGTKTFSNIKKKLKQQKQLQEQNNGTKIPYLMNRISSGKINNNYININNDNDKSNINNSKSKYNNQSKQQLNNNQLSKTNSNNLPIQTIQNNFFKAKIDVKNLIKQKTVLEFLQQIFLQQYLKLFEQNNITQLSDLRFLSQQQLHQMGLPKGHIIKIIKRIKQQFQKNKSPSKINNFIINQNNHIINNNHNNEQNNNHNNQQYYFNNDKVIQQKPKTSKICVEMGYGDGNINDYANIEQQQNNKQELQQKFDQVNSQDMQQQEYNDIVLITVPLSQIALQTANCEQDDNQLGSSMAQNCFNCYKSIPLKNQLFTSPDNRNFCSNNCLKVYKIQMQKTCPACDKQFFKTNGYYEQGLWFCSLGCCPNKQQIQEMFIEWAVNKQ